MVSAAGGGGEGAIRLRAADGSLTPAEAEKKIRSVHWRRGGQWSDKATPGALRESSGSRPAGRNAQPGQCDQMTFQAGTGKKPCVCRFKSAELETGCRSPYFPLIQSN